MRLETIAAICTPHGRGGIGIIRISGPQALSIASKVLNTTLDLKQYADSATRHLIHGYLTDIAGQTLDEVLVAVMPPNRAYTGEPTVEINCHGGRAVLASGLEAVIQAGAKPAEPGEYTRKAFFNGKLDLVQAEAINDLINARTKKGIQAAWRHLEGGLSNCCQSLRESLVRIYSEIQAAIDFDISENDQWEKDLIQTGHIIQKLIQAASRNKFLQQGCWIALTGLPNSGKSSLFNAILNMDRSLVCDIPGTTRDHISETLEIEGIEIRITDTAGIRETSDIIEKASIERSKQQVEAADFVIHVLDQSQPLKQEDIELIRSRQNITLLVINKNDLPCHPSVSKFLGESLGMPVISISALTRDGIDEFMNRLSEMIVSKTSNVESPILTNIRQGTLLAKTSGNIQTAIKLLSENGKLDLISSEIHDGIQSLEEIIGVIDNETILDQIFSKFCIGK